MCFVHTVPGYFSHLHVLWNWVCANFLLSKQLLSQIVVDISVWSDRPGAAIPSIHILVSDHSCIHRGIEIHTTVLTWN